MTDKAENAATSPQPQVQDNQGDKPFAFFLSSEDWQTLRLLIPFFSEYRVRILLALGVLVAVTAATLVLPFLLKHIVDLYQGG